MGNSFAKLKKIVLLSGNKWDDGKYVCAISKMESTERSIFLYKKAFPSAQITEQ